MPGLNTGRLIGLYLIWTTEQTDRHGYHSIQQQLSFLLHFSYVSFMVNNDVCATFILSKSEEETGIVRGSSLLSYI